jgi:peptidyl-tRNA hydrolase, PTH2 family
MSNIKQVIVIRDDLNMRKGKMVAQGSHASMMFIKHSIGIFDEDVTILLSDIDNEWLFGSMTKICVRAKDLNELLVVYNDAIKAGLTAYIVEDYGLTEFNGVKTLTAVAIGPDYCENIDKITGKLKLL